MEAKSEEGDGANRALTVTAQRNVQTLADFGQSWQDARQGSCAEVRRKRLSGSLFFPPPSLPLLRDVS
jgi:hypothetical protein